MKPVTSMFPLRRALPAAALLAAALLTACWFSDDKVAGGDATETGNAITARVTFGDGRDAAGARVTLIPSDYNPVSGQALPDSLTRTTDAEGEVKFIRLAPGRYNIQAFHAATGLRLLLPGIAPKPDKEVAVADSLRSTGSLDVPLPETADTGEAYIYVPGSTFETRVDAAMRRLGRVRLDSLPAGIIPVLMYTRGDTGAPQVPVAADVPVGGGVTYQVPPFSLWAHSARLVLNTSAAGVPIAAAVRNFPLLVRLAAPSFDFSQARGDGGDLRFSGPAGRRLPHEIEDWDSAGGRADVWVRVDSIVPGSDTQSVTMHWGSSQGVGGPQPAVFDTAAGFASVWHMAEEAPDTVTDGLYRDAVPGGAAGNDRIASTDRGGVIGNGHGLRHGDYVQAPVVSERLRLINAFTVSTWFKAGAAQGDTGGEMLSVGDNYGLRLPKLPTSNLHSWYWYQTPPAGSVVGWYSADVKAASYLDSAWHHAAAVYDGAVFHLYMDGVEVANRSVANPVMYLYPLNLTVGKHGNGKTGFEYNGNLDEIEVHSAARGADWLKLVFENQRPGSAFPARVP
jgi:hypothetical protein